MNRKSVDAFVNRNSERPPKQRLAESQLFDRVLEASEGTLGYYKGLQGFGDSASGFKSIPFQRFAG